MKVQMILDGDNWINRRSLGIGDLLNSGIIKRAEDLDDESTEAYVVVDRRAFDKHQKREASEVFGVE